jgi:hypothetical protein
VKRVRLAAALILLATIAPGLPSYVGYSGAPGSSGTCAGTCHGSSGGTIEVVGFPAAYDAGQSYVISVVHRGGSTISNFNASVRVGTGSTNAGTITAGYRTAIYNAGGETNGVHLSSTNQDSCTFNWQAPDPAVGDVRLYLAGHQGSQGGANTEITLTASQLTGVSEGTRRSVGLAFTLRPTIATDQVYIRLSAPAGSRASLRVVDRIGRLAARIAVPGSGQLLAWRPLDREGRLLAAGTYLVVLEDDGQRLVRKLILK